MCKGSGAKVTGTEDELRDTGQGHWSKIFLVEVQGEVKGQP